MRSFHWDTIPVTPGAGRGTGTPREIQDGAPSGFRAGPRATGRQIHPLVTQVAGWMGAW